MSSQDQASNQAGKLRRHCVCGMRLNFCTNWSGRQPTETEKYSHYVNRMKLILGSHMLSLTWQDNICFHRASRFSLQTKLCCIKELIFPPVMFKMGRGFALHNLKPLLLKMRVTLVMALSLSLQTLLKTETISLWGKSVCACWRNHTVPLLFCNYPISNWKDTKCIHAWYTRVGKNDSSKCQMCKELWCCTLGRWRLTATSRSYFQTHKTRSSLQGWVNTTWRLSLSSVTVAP